MEKSQLKSILEAMIFVTEEPIGEQAMVKLLEPEGVDRSSVKEAIADITRAWNENPEVGIKLEEIAGGYQFRTKESCAEWVKRLFTSKPARLSQPAMETLAIIAYRQPIIRSEIEQVRGVDSGGVLKTLLERKLIRIVGKRDEPGQPLIYGTTKEFMELFGLGSLRDLPALRDLKELAQRGMDAKSETPESEEGEEEEPTAVIRKRDEEEEEEPTEVISRLEHDEEEDQNAMAYLESSLKGLRRLEKAIFPKPVKQPEQGAEGAEHAANDTQEGASTEGTETSSGAPSSSDQDAPEQVDRSGE